MCSIPDKCPSCPDSTIQNGKCSVCHADFNVRGVSFKQRPQKSPWSVLPKVAEVAPYYISYRYRDNNWKRSAKLWEESRSNGPTSEPYKRYRTKFR